MVEAWRQGRSILAGSSLLPRELAHETILPEDFVENGASVMDLVVVERHPEASTLAQQLIKQFESGIHHAEPLVVAQHVLFVHGVAVEPLPHNGAIDVVAVTPLLVAGVVRRINEDTVHLLRVIWEKRLEGDEVVASDDQIAGEIRTTDGFLGVGDNRAVRHTEVVVVDELFSLEVQLRHVAPLDALCLGCFR